jgi:PAS domain S-box-containing protein
MDSDDSVTQVLHQTLLGDAWDHAGEAVVVFDDDRNYLAFNDAYCRLIGYSRQEITAMRAGGNLAADDDSHAAFERRLSGDETGVGRARVRRKDGSLIEVCYRMIETTVAHLPYYIALVWEPS